ncbi:iron ABC transporter permease [Chitinispirillales bacterium ANBcel5]|uniref:FecCD family ABC transporter permease n=1 Tax=Cellulosispirillum alkaliphilum TaxID=3039283 RepID=UPI002A55523F|nr:iron ABC transporter permease [Chitinispirillales bacterium ANBcel5]
MSTIKRPSVVVPLLLLIGLTTLFVCPGIGIRWISPLDIFQNDDLRYIFLSIRVPRTLTAFFAGGGLAVAGMIYQAVFRNPLACPHILGVSSGASLGAALCIVAGLAGSLLGLSIITLGAFAGAVGSILIICAFAWTRESNSSTLLLAGVVVATLCSGLIMFIHMIGGIHKSFQILRWIMGGVDGVSYSLLLLMLAPLSVFLGITVLFTPRLDQFLTGEEIAHSRGINVKLSRNILIISTAVAVGGIVAACGPIGFIGIIAPHVCRMILPGIRHRLLSLCSFLLGGSFLVLADTLARSIAPPTEIPVGIITSLLGGPFFLVILARQKKRYLM